MHGLYNRLVCVFCAACIAMAPNHAVLAAASASDLTDKAEMELRIELLGRKTEQLRAALKRERFDTEARVESSDYELEALVQFVRNEIVFQPYEGTLRGPGGTLRARAGNSLDQSLLLAQMIRIAGFDARIVRGELIGEPAMRLLDVTANAPEAASLDYFDQAIARIFGRAVDQVTEVPPIAVSEYAGDTQRHTDILLGILDDSGLELRPMDVTERLLQTLRDYFWVEYREGPSTPWQQAHPAFGAMEPPRELAPLEFFAQSIPDTYQHRFEMRAWVEQWLNGKIERHALMAPWVAPVANVSGMALRFQNVPNGIDRSPAADVTEILNSTSVLTPFFGQAVPDGAMAFDLQGRVIDPMVQAGGGAAGVFKSVGDGFLDAANQMADRPDAKPLMALHSMYLEFSFHRPNGESETRRRYLLPPRESYDDAPGELLRKLITAHTYMIASGGQPQEVIADQFIEGTVSDLDWLKYVVLQQQALPAQELPPPGKPFSAFPTLYQLWSMERFPVSKEVVRFRAQPALVGIREGFNDPNTLFSEVDVVWNTVESLRRGAAGWETAPRDSLAAGVWDTLLESMPLDSRPDSPLTVANTPRIFELARAQGIKPLVLRPQRNTDAALESLSLDAHARQFVRRDLDAGYAVIIPARTPAGAPMSGWWRVRPDTGETLGMTGDGYGASMAEYVAVLSLVALGFTVAMRATVEYSKCGGQGSLKAGLCCALEKHLGLVGKEAKGGKVVDKSGEAMHDMLCND